MDKDIYVADFNAWNEEEEEELDALNDIFNL